MKFCGYTILLIGFVMLMYMGGLCFMSDEPSQVFVRRNWVTYTVGMGVCGLLIAEFRKD